jgi:hypothetical protein
MSLSTFNELARFYNAAQGGPVVRVGSLAEDGVFQRDHRDNAWVGRHHAYLG